MNRKNAYLTKIAAGLMCIGVLLTLGAPQIQAQGGQTLVCPQQEHVHALGACYEMQLTPVCAQAEDDFPQHDEFCHKVAPVYSCTLAEHTHQPECWQTENVEQVDDTTIPSDENNSDAENDVDNTGTGETENTNEDDPENDDETGEDEMPDGENAGEEDTEDKDENEEYDEAEEDDDEEDANGPLNLTAEGLDINVRITAPDEQALPEGTTLHAAQAAVTNSLQETIAPTTVQSDADALYQSMVTDDALVLAAAGGAVDETIAPVKTETLEDIAANEAGIPYTTMAALPLDITLVGKDGEEVQPNGTVSVAIEIPAGIEHETAAVYHMAADGTTEKMNTRLQDGALVFETAHFSIYTIIGTTRTTAATLLTQQPGQKLNGGVVYTIGADTKIEGVMGTYTQNALVVDATNSNEPAVLYIPYDLTLTVIGGVGDFRFTSAGAGILLEDGNHLYIRGNGTLIARGGNGDSGLVPNGNRAYIATASKYNYGQLSPGGYGGAGAYGGGAAIGTMGGASGEGAPFTGYPNSISSMDLTLANQVAGLNGKNATPGGDTGDAGTLHVLDTVTVVANGGTGGANGSGGDFATSADNKGSDKPNKFFLGGGGGGGGGGAGGSGASIGSGGGGGGGGGCGGGGGMKANTGQYGVTSSYPTGSGGKGGKGAVNGGDGAGIQRWNGGSGGEGAAAGTSGSGGTVYIASTAQCVVSGGKDIHGQAANINKIGAEKNSFYKLDFAVQTPAQASGTATANITGTSIYAGVAPAVKPVATLEGWFFKGWYSAQSGGVQVINQDGNFLSGVAGYTNANGHWIFGNDTTLYAQFEPGIHEITLNNQGANTATAGTAVVYEKYDFGWYANREGTQAISKITLPQRRGYTFMGYYKEIDGGGAEVVDANGNITAPGTEYSGSQMAFAYWHATPYEVSLSLSLDGADFTGQKVELYQYGYLKFTLEELPASPGVYFSNEVITGEYNIYLNGEATSATVNVDAANASKQLSFYMLAVTTSLDGAGTNFAPVTLRQNGLVRYKSVYDGAQQAHIAYALHEPGGTAANTYDVYVDGEAAGMQIVVAKDETHTPAKTVFYYTAEVNITHSESLWNNAQVTLVQNGKPLHTLGYKSNDGANTASYQKAVRGDTAADDYTVYVNGISTQQTLSLTTNGFNGSLHIANLSYYKVTVPVNRDDAPWADTSLTLRRAGETRYALSYNSGENAYTHNYVRDIGVAYDLCVSGVNGGINTGEEITLATPAPTSLEYYTAKYYNGTEIYTTQTWRKNAAVVLPTAPKLQGKTFAGWHTGAQESDPPFANGTQISAPLQLYAHFSQPQVWINGYVRCNADGTANGEGKAYRMANLSMENLPSEGAPVVSAVLNVTNGNVSVLNTSGHSITNNIVAASGNGTVIITFKSGLTPAQAEEFLCQNIVVTVKDPAAEHKMNVRFMCTAL